MKNLVRWLVGLVFLSCAPKATAQKETYLAYCKHYQKGLTLSSASHHAAAMAEFDTAFSIYPWVPSHYFDGVLACLLANDVEHANEFLSLGVRHGFTPDTFYDSLYTAHLNGDGSLPFRQKWQEDKLAFGAVADSALIKELDAMRDLDQSVRTSAADKETARIDSLNFEHLIAIFRRKGVPSSRTIGQTTGTVHLLLWHHRGLKYPNSAQWQRVLPFIHEAILAGEIAPSYLCMFDDMTDYDAGRPMRYGTLLYYFHEQGNIQLVERDALNRNRASVGLGSIEDFALVTGIDLESVLAK